MENAGNSFGAQLSFSRSGKAERHTVSAQCLQKREVIESEIARTLLQYSLTNAHKYSPLSPRGENP